ncbi:MAG: hypothetical protein AABX05_02090 [Nanoarchaeota archaeon]
MAKAIEQTPVLEGIEAKRFLDLLLANEKEVILTEYEKKVKGMLSKLPKALKL